MLSFSDLEKRLRANYEIRLNGSTLVYRRGRGGPYRSMPGLLGEFLKAELSRRPFGGQGEDRSGEWHKDLIEDFKAYITVGAEKFDQLREQLSNIPQTTTKVLIKGDSI